MATQWNSESLSPRPSGAQSTIVGLFRHAVNEAADLVRSEANLVKLELEENIRAIITDALNATLYSTIALLGLLSLLAFLIVGLAALIVGHVAAITSFWASALIIGVVFTTAGGLMAMRHAKRMGHDVQMKKSRIDIATDEQFIKNGWKKRSETGDHDAP